MTRTSKDWPAECAGAWGLACRWRSEEHCNVWHSRTWASRQSQCAQHSHTHCSSSCSCGELWALTFGKEGTEILYCTVNVCDAIGIENKKERMLVEDKKNKSVMKTWTNSSNFCLESHISKRSVTELSSNGQQTTCCDIFNVSGLCVIWLIYLMKSSY